jgi:hypothetical protein
MSLEQIQQAIEKKQGQYPYYATVESLIQSNISHNPYTEFFRGDKNRSSPTVCDREAGKQSLDNTVIFKPPCHKMPNPTINTCWQYSCSLIRPCKNTGCNSRGCKRGGCKSCGIYNHFCESYTDCDCVVTHF